VNTRK